MQHLLPQMVVGVAVLRGSYSVGQEYEEQSNYKDIIKIDLNRVKWHVLQHFVLNINTNI